ncbi:uncharacterized protein JCM10292_006315 [Rhodotorula paludigena]|uniref:uncharacterized protein n=1 Tax=Rhodotorula paludigena TaxID=86838 RepID=UPI003172D820
MSTTTRSTAVAPLPDTSKSVLTLLASLSPLYFLVQSRSRLGLDALHIGLLQVLLLLILRAGLDMVPSSLRRRPTPALPPIVVQDVPVEPEVEAVVSHSRAKERTTKRRRIKSVVSGPPPPFPADKLDETVANFLHITAPAFLAYVPVKPSTSISAAPLADWKSTFEGENVEVLQHPKLASLFGICATFPGVPLRNLYQVLQDVGSRSKWDSMAQGADEIERFEVEGRQGNCLHMRMKGMAMVKAKDLVLLSVAGKLPVVADHPAPSMPVSDKFRIFAATTSVDHPKVPPTSAFNRMELSVSGFLIEEVGDGSKIVQITDLSGLGSWIPGAIIRTITQTMLPKSLVKLGATAAALTEAELTSEFPPRTLGAAPPPASTQDTSGEPSSEADESDLDEDEDEPSTGLTTPSSSDPSLSPSASRDLHTLLSHLRSVTSRLAALETLVASPPLSAPPPPAAGARAPARPWYALFGGSSAAPSPGTQRRVGGGKTDDMLTASAGAGQSTLSALVALGSAAAATAAVAAVAAWAKRRR